MAEVKRWTIDLPDTRVDEFPWRIHVHEIVGDRPGPATAVISGTIGDKPLGVLALHDLVGKLADRKDIAGRIIIIPAANPFGLQGGTRHNPDLVELHRRFPGSTRGLVSDQLAHALMTALFERVDAIIDLHSGTPMRRTVFAYDYGNLDMTASAAHMPVMINRHNPGNLCSSAMAKGIKSCTLEFGGGSDQDTETGLESVLNILRYRGHLDDAPTGPDKVAVFDKVKYCVASTDGALCSPYGPEYVGRPVPSGVFAWITNVVTGQRVEEFTVPAIGEKTGEGPDFIHFGRVVMEPFVMAELPLLMIAQYVPSMVRAGALLFMLGWSRGDMPVPRR